MKNDFTQLLIDIQKKSAITVENVRDVKHLKDEIESETKYKIGYNTLRRLFGFLPQTLPSKSTLTILSKYLGFASYSNYINNKLNYDEWYFQQKLIRIQLENKLDDVIIKFIENGLTNKNNIVAVANFIVNYINKNDINKLKHIFKELKFPSLSDSEYLKFSTIISFNLINKDEQYALNIYKELIDYKNFRTLVPLFFIDYSNLSGLYLKVLKLIKNITSQKSELLFVELMHFYKKYYFIESTKKDKEIKQPSDFELYHHVLKGRYLGYLILNAEEIDRNLKNIILDSFKKNKISLLSQEVITSLIIKEEYELLSIIFKKHYEDIFESSSWSYKTTNSINLIGLANVNWYNKKNIAAKNNLELVELEKVEIGYYDYISMFYYLTKIKISFSENDITANKEAIYILNELVNKTKFKRFQKQANQFEL